MGEIDSRFEWLEKAIDEHDGWILHLPVDPAYERLRTLPHYPALLRK